MSNTWITIETVNASKLVTPIRVEYSVYKLGERQAIKGWYRPDIERLPADGNSGNSCRRDGANDAGLGRLEARSLHMDGCCPPNRTNATHVSNTYYDHVVGGHPLDQAPVAK